MKKKTFTTIAAAFIMMSISAQPSMQFSLGGNTAGFGSMELSAQHRVNSALIQAGYIIDLTRNVRGGPLLNVTAGAHLPVGEDTWIEPMAGYGYLMRSSDDKSLNTKTPVVNFAAGKDINAGSVVLKAAWCKGKVIGLVGMRYNF